MRTSSTVPLAVYRLSIVRTQNTGAAPVTVTGARAGNPARRRDRFLGRGRDSRARRVVCSWSL